MAGERHRSGSRLARRLAVVCGLTLLTAACGAGVPPRPGPPVFVTATCPADQPEPGRAPAQVGGEIPADFHVAWALRCRVAAKPVPGDGLWSYLITERADTDAAALVAELRRPSDPPRNVVCVASLLVVPYFALVAADGTAIRPALPMSVCGPRPEPVRTLNALPFHTVGEVRLRQEQTEREVESYCARRPTAAGPPPEAAGCPPTR